MKDNSDRKKPASKGKVGKKTADPDKNSVPSGTSSTKSSKQDLYRDYDQEGSSNIRRLVKERAEFLKLLDFLDKAGMLVLSEHRELHDALLNGDDNRLRRTLRKDREETAIRQGQLIADYDEAIIFFDELETKFKATIANANSRIKSFNLDINEPAPENKKTLKADAESTFRDIQTEYIASEKIEDAIGICYATLSPVFDATRKILSYYQEKHPELRSQSVNSLLKEARSLLRYGESGPGGKVGLRKVEFAVHKLYSKPPSRNLLETQQMVLFEACGKAPSLKVLYRLNFERKLDWLEQYFAWLFFQIAVRRARAIIMHIRDESVFICDDAKLPEKTRKAIWKYCNRFTHWLLVASQLYQERHPTVQEQAMKALEMHRKRSE